MIFTQGLNHLSVLTDTKQDDFSFDDDEDDFDDDFDVEVTQEEIDNYVDDLDDGFNFRPDSECLEEDDDDEDDFDDEDKDEGPEEGHPFNIEYMDEDFYETFLDYDTWSH